MTRRFRYFALGLFLLAPCVARCDDLPTIDNAVLEAIKGALYVNVFNPDDDTYTLVPLFSPSQSALPADYWGSPYSIGDFFMNAFSYLGYGKTGDGFTLLGVWQLLEDFGAGYIDWDHYPPLFIQSGDSSVSDALTNTDFIVSCSEAFTRSKTELLLYGDPNAEVGSLFLGSLLAPQIPKVVDNLANGNFGGGNGGGDGGDQTINIKIHGGVTNITRILTNHFDRATNHFNVVSNSLVTITNSVVVITNQIEIALDYLKQIATNTQQDAIITIMEFMTNNWPDVNISLPDHSNDVQDVTNKLRVGRYTFRADMGPLIIPDRDFGDQSASRKWSYRVDEHGNYYIDGFADDTQYLYGQLDNGEWEFGEVVTYTLQMIADKAQDIKNSLWILNHSIDTNSVDVNVSELDSYKREVDSFVQGTQSTLESVFYNVELDDGIFTKFKNNFVAIFGTVGRGPPVLRGAKNAGSRQTVWSFYVGDQRWDISLDSTLYTSSRRLCRMAASMVWCVLLWLAFRKLLIRAIYWMVKCIDWCFQVFGFQIKWLGTVEEFLKHIAGIGPGG